MSSKGQPRWNIKAPDAKDEKAKPLKMAEPMHRKPPRGASTGQSLRSFELSPLQMVKEICLFYVKKCSGKYTDNKTAARYVHQMSQEVITQLAGVAGEVKRNKGDPELYQALLDEWNENFPPSLGSMGSPKAIAALVASQSTEIEDLRHKLEGEVTRREKDVSEILRSMDAQLQAYKASVMTERRHQHLVEGTLREEHEAALDSMKQQHQADLERIVAHQAKEAKKHDAAFEVRIAESDKVVADLTKQLESNVRRQQRDVEAIVRSKDRRYDKLDTKYSRLKDRYLELVSHLNEEFSVLSSPSMFDDDEEEDDEDEDESVGNLTEPSEGTVSQEERLHKERRQQKEVERRERQELKELEKAERQRKKEELLHKLKASPIGSGTAGDSAVDRSFAYEEEEGNLVTGSAAGMGEAGGAVRRRVASTKQQRQQSKSTDVYNVLKRQIESLSTLNVSQQKQIDDSAKKLNNILRENDLYKARMHEFEKQNESLRRALGAVANQAGELDVESMRTLKPSQVLLCHTPHFLGPADKSGFAAGKKPKLTAYNTAGRF